MDIARCSALVNGGAGGLGGATARRLHGLGAGVVIFDPSGDRAAALAAELGPRAAAVPGDQSDDDAVAEAIAAAQALGAFSICVNAAGAMLPSQPMVDDHGEAHEMQLFRAMVQMHLMGPFNVSRLSAAAFAANPPDEDGQPGVIINTASTAAFDGQARQTAYSASKAAIVGLTTAMARDLAAIGVRACAIAPGPITTPRLASAPPAVQARLIQDVAFPKRFGQAEEYASLVEAIVPTTFLNGQVIRLDGAMSTGLQPIG